MVSELAVTKRSSLVRLGAAALLIAAAVCLMRLGAMPPHLIDQCDHRSDSRVSAPVIVVGVLTSDTLVSRPVPMHSDPKYPLQLRRLTARVENVHRSLWIYTVDLVRPNIKRDAEEAMHAANCCCTKNADGNVECQ